jgi:hypothetical protein
MTPTPPRRSTAGRVIAILTGAVAALVAVGLLAAGGLALWADGQKDDDGFLSSGTGRLTAGTYALASENLDVNGDIPSWVASPDRYGKVRLTASSRQGKPVFVGIARTSDVNAYLGRSPHTVVSDFSTDPFDAAYSDRPGTRRPARPGDQDIWVASAGGSGPQQVTWDVAHGDWSVVVMNADGSRGVDASVSAGADIPILGAIGWGSIGAGLLALLASGALLYIGLREAHVRRDAPGNGGLVPAAGS